MATRSFEEILDEQLGWWENNMPEADRSQGSMIYLKCASQAGIIWGLEKRQEIISKERLPSTAAAPYDWGAEFGLYPTPGETEQAFLNRLHERLRNAPAGGNRPDYIAWAKEVSGVHQAWIHEGAPVGGLGVVQLTLQGTELNGAVGSGVAEAVHANVLSKRPVGLYILRVISAEPYMVSVQLTGSGVNWDPVACLAEITAYMAALPPDTALYRDQLKAIAVNNGAEGNPVLVSPATDMPATGPSSGAPSFPVMYRLMPELSGVS